MVRDDAGDPVLFSNVDPILGAQLPRGLHGTIHREEVARYLTGDG